MPSKVTRPTECIQASPLAGLDEDTTRFDAMYHLVKAGYSHQLCHHHGPYFLWLPVLGWGPEA